MAPSSAAQASRTVKEGDFWPISLSNAIYLIIVKILANRLPEVTGTILGIFHCWSLWWWKRS